MSEGRHIKVVGKGNPLKLGNVAIVQNFLERLVRELGMRPLGPVHLYDVPLEVAKLGSEVFEDEGGVTGVVVLSTSHCSIHTWPLREHFVLDVYSCRDFDPGLVTEALRKTFELHHVRVSDLSDSLSLR